MNADRPPSALRHVLRIGAMLILLCPTAGFAAKPSKAELKEAKREGLLDFPAEKGNKRDDKAGNRADRDANAPGESRQLTKLREHLEVTDDAEWAVIAERITRVEESRKSQITAGRGPVGAGEKSKRGERSSAGNQEIEALKSAVRDQYPDAEIKARLARAHEAQQQRAAQLAKAQEELRAVLNIRQEAILVMAGVLPP